MKAFTPFSCRSYSKISFEFLSFRGLFNSAGFHDGKEFQPHTPASKGDWCMKDTDHPTSHPRVHHGDRGSALRRRVCA